MVVSASNKGVRKLAKSTRFTLTNPHPDNIRANDCVVRAISIAFQIDYKVALDVVATDVAIAEGSTVEQATDRIFRFGTPSKVWHKTMKRHGWKYIRPVANKLAKGHRVTFRPEFMPQDETVIVNIKRHAAAVVNGELKDTWNSMGKSGTKQLYGYFVQPDSKEAKFGDGYWERRLAFVASTYVHGKVNAQWIRDNWNTKVTRPRSSNPAYRWSMDKATKIYSLKHRDFNAPSMMMEKIGRQEWKLSWIERGRAAVYTARTRKDVKEYAHALLETKGFDVSGIELGQ